MFFLDESIKGIVYFYFFLVFWFFEVDLRFFLKFGGVYLIIFWFFIEDDVRVYIFLGEEVFIEIID